MSSRERVFVSCSGVARAGEWFVKRALESGEFFMETGPATLVRSRPSQSVGQALDADKVVNGARVFAGKKMSRPTRRMDVGRGKKKRFWEKLERSGPLSASAWNVLFHLTDVGRVGRRLSRLGFWCLFFGRLRFVWVILGVCCWHTRSRL